MSLLKSLRCVRMGNAALARPALGPKPVKLKNFANKFITLPNPSNLCWASVVVTALRYTKLPVPADHCDLAARILGGCTVSACSSPACNIPIPVSDGLQAAIGVMIRAISGTLLSFQAVKDDIGNGSGKPILCEEDGGRHAVLLWGYLDTAEQWVYRADPAKFKKEDSWKITELAITGYYRI